MRTPPTLHINVNTNSPLKWDQWERRSCIVGWLWARERNKTFLAGLRLIWGYTDASSDEHIIGKIITVINMLSIQRKTYKWARKALLYHVVQRTAVFEPLRSVSCSSRCQRHTAALFRLASPQKNIRMTEGKATQYSEKVKYRFSRTICLCSCQSKMNSESNKQKDLKLKAIISKWSEVLIRFVDNASGRMALKLTGRPYQQI